MFSSKKGRGHHAVPKNRLTNNSFRPTNGAYEDVADKQQPQQLQQQRPQQLEQQQSQQHNQQHQQQLPSPAPVYHGAANGEYVGESEMRTRQQLLHNTNNGSLSSELPPPDDGRYKTTNDNVVSYSNIKQSDSISPRDAANLALTPSRHNHHHSMQQQQQHEYEAPHRVEGNQQQQRSPPVASEYGSRSRDNVQNMHPQQPQQEEVRSSNHSADYNTRSSIGSGSHASHGSRQQQPPQNYQEVQQQQQPRMSGYGLRGSLGQQQQRQQNHSEGGKEASLSPPSSEQLGYSNRNSSGNNNKSYRNQSHRRNRSTPMFSSYTNESIPEDQHQQEQQKDQVPHQSSYPPQAAPPLVSSHSHDGVDFTSQRGDSAVVSDRDSYSQPPQQLQQQRHPLRSAASPRSISSANYPGTPSSLSSNQNNGYSNNHHMGGGGIINVRSFDSGSSSGNNRYSAGSHNSVGSANTPYSASSRTSPQRRALQARALFATSHENSDAASWSNSNNTNNYAQDEDEDKPNLWSHLSPNDIATIIPPLTFQSHKGSNGRIGVIGGSPQYTGAPYYASLSALHCGADLSYIFCAEEASLAIKTYSPELMVSPFYSQKDLEDAVGDTEREELLIKNGISTIGKAMERLHCLIIGPGLGRDARVGKMVTQVMKMAMGANVPLVLDADALYLLSLERYSSILENRHYYSQQNSKKQQQFLSPSPIVLTPNIVEYRRLVKAGSKLDDAIIVLKGHHDTVLTLLPHATRQRMVCREVGGMKRCGGIGDVLAGCVGAFVGWYWIGVKNMSSSQTMLTSTNNSGSTSIAGSVASAGTGGGAASASTSSGVDLSPQNVKNGEAILKSVWAACCVAKKSTKLAFDLHRRGMTAPNVMEQVAVVVDDMAQPMDDLNDVNIQKEEEAVLNLALEQNSIPQQQQQQQNPPSLPQGGNDGASMPKSGNYNNDMQYHSNTNNNNGKKGLRPNNKRNDSHPDDEIEI